MKAIVAVLILTLSPLLGVSAMENHYQGRRIEARSMTVELDGKKLERDLVTHPGAVVVLPILDDGRILMIRNHRPAVGETLWELPAGTLEADEDPLHAAERELEEETGYVTAQIEPVIDCFASPGYCTELFHLFRATKLSETRQKLEEGEQITVHPLTREEVRTLISEGQIRDAKTLVVLLMDELGLEKRKAGA